MLTHGEWFALTQFLSLVPVALLTVGLVLTKVKS